MKSKWRPIKTAPKDRVVLLFGSQRPCELIRADGKFVFSGYWDHLDAAWCATGTTYCGPFYKPTHWQPLPAPPGAD